MNLWPMLAAGMAALSPAPSDGDIATPRDGNIPASVRAMIDAAIESGSEAEIAAVVKFAARANPDHEREILAILAERRESRRAAEERRLAEAGLMEIWSGRGELGASRSTGNTDMLGVFASLRLAREGLNWRHGIRAEADIQEREGVATKERFLAAYEPHYKISDRLSAYGLVQYERDTAVGFDARYAASGGLGYALVQGPDLSIDLQGGPAFRHTDFNTGMAEESIGGRAALDARWRLTPTLSLTQNASAIVETQNSTIVATTGLETKLVGALTARASYNLQYESDPALGREPLDTLSRVTLVYAF